ncbi:Uncharacterised protein [Nocardia otitidiscaviarum]|uniref:Uncharacterized protein n=1 Tax=Nocardia otitidiscaviarum TaxID=1823 RepID=A0A379JLK9_9NOCA|nr:hypothetical protein [Nocardia otitidiscaviarum]SUD49539.1 Uncharacterised protein [Nocardia otitidiscaviarum]
MLTPSKAAASVRTALCAESPTATFTDLDTLRWLDRMATAQQPAPGGYLEPAADLAVKALMVAATLWPYRGGRAAAGIRAELNEQIRIYSRSAAEWRQRGTSALTASVSPQRARDYAQTFDDAADALAEIVRALETEFAADL